MRGALRLASLFATCLSWMTACGDGGPSTDARPTDDAGCDLTGTGQFRVTWSTTSGGAPISCSAAGATWFDLQSTDSSSATVADRFQCNLMTGVTGALHVGHYTYIGSLLSSGLDSVAEAPSATATLCHDGEIVDLPPFTFDF